MGAVTGNTASQPESEKTETSAAPEPDDAEVDNEPVERRTRRPDRAGMFIAGAVLAACAGLVLYGVLGTGDDNSTAKQRTPTAPVTYEVTGAGTADIIYQARSETGQATVVKAATLPWRATVEVPLGQDPIVGIVLDEQGGQARCALAIRGQHIQSATAAGEFGRATCAGHLPGPNAPEH